MQHRRALIVVQSGGLAMQKLRYSNEAASTSLMRCRRPNMSVSYPSMFTRGSPQRTTIHLSGQQFFLTGEKSRLVEYMKIPKAPPSKFCCFNGGGVIHSKPDATYAIVFRPTLPDYCDHANLCANLWPILSMPSRFSCDLLSLAMTLARIPRVHYCTILPL